MGNDEKVSREAHETVASRAYTDALQPAALELGDRLVPVARDVGESFQLLSGTIKRLLFSPLRGFIWGFDEIETRFLPSLAEKIRRRLGARPESALASPPPHIVGPTLESLRFTGAIPPLREMYENLLVTAMDIETVENAHPAFVEIIRQLAPDEAAILNRLATRNASQVKYITVAFRDSQDEAFGPKLTYRVVRDSLAILRTSDHFRRFTLIPSYLDNLERLQLGRFVFQPNLSRQVTEDMLGEFKGWLSIHSRYGSNGLIEDYKTMQGTDRMSHFELTSFGKQFCRACIWNEEGEKGTS